MLDKEQVVSVMKDRGFVLQVVAGGVDLHFISEHAFNYQLINESNPVIYVTVSLKQEEYNLSYHLNGSLNILITPSLGSFLDDDRFYSILSQFTTQASWLARIAI